MDGGLMVLTRGMRGETVSTDGRVYVIQERFGIKALVKVDYI